VRPVLGRDAFDDPDWFFEPKYDGFRGLAYLTREACVLRSRNDNAFGRFAGLANAIRDELEMREAILDGEVVALDRYGRVCFDDLMRGTGRLGYAVFDLLWLNGRDLRDLPLRRRKQLLDSTLPNSTASVTKVFWVERDGVALFEAVSRLNLEGVVAKRGDDRYGPETVWHKILNPGYTQKIGRAEWFNRARER
jgi:bifunctional non-homologous end joining protein LigD